MPGAGKTAGPFTTLPLSKNIPWKGPMTADLSTTLRSGRDDKGEGRYGPQQRSRDGQTAGPSTTLRSGRDDNSVWSVRASAVDNLTLQQNCHPDRSAA